MATTNPAVYRPSVRSHARPLAVRTLLLPAAAVALVAAFAIGSSQYPLVPLLIGATLGLFALALNSPAWILAPVLVTELTLASYFIPSLGMSQRLLVTLLATLLGAPTILRWGRFGDPRLRRVLLPTIALVVLATVVNAMFSKDDYVIKYLRYQTVLVLSLILAACLIRTRQDLRRLAYVALGVGLAAAVAAVWQHYAKDIAPYGNATAQSVRSWKGRSLGFSSSPVTLAVQINFVLAPLLGILVCGPWRRDRARGLLVAALLVLAAGLNFSYTRSGVFALGPGLVAMGLFLRGRRRAAVLGAVLVAVLLFQALEGTGLIGSRYYKTASEDQSAASHEALFAVGLAVALDRGTIGIGHEHFEEIAVDYVDEAVSASDGASGASSVGQERPHNDFLSVWISWGILALIAYIAIFLGTLRNLWRAAAHPDLLIRGLAVGTAGGLVIYAANSFFHNYMDSSAALFLYAGLSVALARLAAETKRNGIGRGRLVAPYRSLAYPRQGGN